MNDTGQEAGDYIHLPDLIVVVGRDPRVRDRSIEDSPNPPHLPPPLVRGQPPASGESPVGVLHVLCRWVYRSSRGRSRGRWTTRGAVVNGLHPVRCNPTAM